MAIITTDTWLDDGTPRTAAETWSVSNGSLKIRTDTRWHIGAPAGMTGVFGQITANGGGFVVDGRNVRWLPFNSGSGTVPAIGTTITQGGTSGYLLGVWQDYVSAPTAVGASMPTTGWIKFREVTGAFEAGALTGIGASATAADEPGWIEVVMQQGTFVSVNIVGEGFKSNGEWFSLGTTSGVRGQLIQVPTNGGGSGTYTSAVQIETAPGSNEYEWWLGIPTGSFVNTICASDARAKFFESVPGGAIRIGADSSGNSVAHLPAAGCKVRIPNVFYRQCGTSNRNTNLAPSTSLTARAFVSATSGTNIWVDKMHSDWAWSRSTNDASFYMTNSALDSALQISHCLGDITLDGIGIGAAIANSNTAFVISNSTASSTTSIANVKGVRTVVGTVVSFSGAQNVSSNKIEAILLGTSIAQNLFSVSNSKNCVFANVKTKNGGIQVTSSSDIYINGHDYIERIAGDTTTGGTISCCSVSGSSNVTHTGLTFGEYGTIANTHPYQTLYATSLNNGGVKFRNAGTFANRLNVGSTSTLFPARIVNMVSQYDSGTKFQRIYLGGTRTDLFGSSTGSGTNFVFEHMYGTQSQSLTVRGEDSLVRNLGATINTNSPNAVPGLNWVDTFTADTTGELVFLANSLTAFSSTFTTASVTANKGAGFNGNGTFNFRSTGDTFISETPDWIKGHTGFRNLAPLGAAGSTIAYTYQIDNGSGYGGTWKNLTAANLSAETVNPAGFKFKLRAVAPNNTAQSCTFIKIYTTSTATAQANNLYDLDKVELTFTGLVPGSEVRCYTGSDPATAVEIGGVESTVGSSFTFEHSAGGQVGFIRIFALGYQPISIDPYTFSSSDTSLLIQQVIDRNYVNP